MISMTGRIIKMVDKAHEKNNNSEKPSSLKSFGLGMIEGAIDGIIIAYPILLIGNIIKNKQLKNK